MSGILKNVKNYWFLILTIVVGIYSGIAVLIWPDAPLVKFTPRLGSYIAIYSFYCLAFIIIVIKTVDILVSLRKGNFGVDVLALIAIVSCLAVNEFWAAYVIMLMLATGEALETLANCRAHRELTALIKRRPQIAHLIKHGQISDIDINQVKPDDVLLIKPEEVVPVDGLLLSDGATMDESSITGETTPSDKQKGARIISGTLNSSEAIYIKSVNGAQKSYYGQIINLVRQSESKPAHFVNLANRYALPFTIISLIIASIAWSISGDPRHFAEVLVVASPCPLILAAPIAFVSGMSRSSRHGIIVKNGNVLEQVARADTFAFDKTGTLTKGELEISGIDASPKLTKQAVVSVIAGVESVSSHVLARSVVNFAHYNKIKLVPATGIREIPGGGIFASVGRRRIVAGSLAFLTSNKITNLPDDTGKTAIYLAINGEYAGAICFSDQPRPEAKATVEQLRQLGAKHIAMLSGDKLAVATAVARELGIDQAYGELTPLGKIAAVDKLKESKQRVVMVGDGINDAPVLAHADVGVAMGATGSTIASESADAVITIDQLDRIVTLRQIALRTLSIAKQSVFIGIGLCLILELIALSGIIPAIYGALLQELVDVTVIIAALRAHRD